MRHRRPAAIIAAFLTIASCAMPPETTMPPETNRLTWPDLTTRARPHADAAIPYGTDPLQTVDLWLPAGTGPHPVVVMVHGGCWQTDIADRTLMDWIADDLRRDGIAVWNIEYRGVDRPGGGYPGTFADVGAAADALRGSAAKYRLDLTRVVAIGHSAGGHLALWLAARPKLPESSHLQVANPLQISRIVALGALPDLELTARTPENGCGTDVVARLIRTARRDPYADTSIPRLLPLGIPQTLVNGREDKIIPHGLATDYVAKAKASGDTVDLVTVPSTGHVELIAPETAAWAAAKRAIREGFPR